MSIAGTIRDAARQVGDQARKAWQKAQGSDSVALTHFLRPNLGATPAPLRGVLEPVVAASATLALVVLLGASVTSLSFFIVVSALIYAIITYVFGIELGFALPTSA